MKRHEETRIGFTLPDGRYVEGVWTGREHRATNLEIGLGSFTAIAVFQILARIFT
jgi:hypothetical protein